MLSNSVRSIGIHPGSYPSNRKSNTRWWCHAMMATSQGCWLTEKCNSSWYNHRWRKLCAPKFGIFPILKENRTSPKRCSSSLFTWCTLRKKMRTCSSQIKFQLSSRYQLVMKAASQDRAVSMSGHSMVQAFSHLHRCLYLRDSPHQPRCSSL